MLPLVRNLFAVAILSGISCGLAETACAETTISFNVDQNGSPIKNGQILDNEFNSTQFNNLVISVDYDPSGSSSSGYNLGVAFDSNNVDNQKDPDLLRVNGTQSQWRGGNIGTQGDQGLSTNLGNLLVIQARESKAPADPDKDKNGILDSAVKPNDAEGSPGGIITLDFSNGTKLTSFGMTVVDIAASSAGSYWIQMFNGTQAVGGKIYFDQFTKKSSPFYDSSVVFDVPISSRKSSSDNVANVLAPITLDKLAAKFGSSAATPFDRIKIFMKGGGIGNLHLGLDLKFTHTNPEPASMVLFGMGGLGMAAIARSRGRLRNRRAQGLNGQ